MYQLLISGRVRLLGMYVYTPLFLCQLEFIHAVGYLQKQTPENLLFLQQGKATRGFFLVALFPASNSHVTLLSVTDGHDLLDTKL